MNAHDVSFLYKKIAIIGCGGSGKTTLANKLGPLLNIPVYHLDQYYWKPGWIQSDLETFKKEHEKLCAQETWIIDGNQMSTIADRINKADMIIFLNMPGLLCLWRIVARWLRFRKRRRNDIPEGCCDSITWGFFSYVWHFNQRFRPRILTILNQLSPDKEVHILHSSSDVEEFMQSLDQCL